MSRLTIPGFQFTIMAKESMRVNFAGINTMASAEVSEKALRAVNGSNATLAPGVEILILASEAKTRPIQTSRGQVLTPHVPFIKS